MTKDELKKTLASKENRLAKRALEIIKNSGSPEELKALIAQGCPDKYFERDPQHPRSKYRILHVLDACFESQFGVISTHENGSSKTAVLGDIHRSQGREEYFKILLEAGFQRGSNGWRGDLFEHILNSCFYAARTENEKQRKTQALKFAKILCQLGKVNINSYAARSYAWVSNPENLQTLLELGANLQSSAPIDCALRYVGCSSNSGEPPEGRIDVIKKLLELGAKPKNDLNKSVNWQWTRKKLKDHELLDTMVSFGIIEACDGPEYDQWLKFYAPTQN